MENEKFFVSAQGRLVILYESEGTKHIMVCEPVEDVVYASIVGRKGRAKGGVRHCKKCGEAGHTSRTCQKK